MTVMYLDEKGLVIEFGEDRNVRMDLSEQEASVIKTILDDPNMWANFLGSLSVALTQHV